MLCLAGAVEATAVDDFLRRYGPEPMRVDGIDAGSATSLSQPALDLVHDHLDAAERAGHPVAVRGLDRQEARWPTTDPRSR